MTGSTEWMTHASCYTGTYLQPSVESCETPLSNAVFCSALGWNSGSTARPKALVYLEFVRKGLGWILHDHP